jgi:hypothetical protein
MELATQMSIVKGKARVQNMREKKSHRQKIRPSFFSDKTENTSAAPSSSGKGERKEKDREQTWKS